MKVKRFNDNGFETISILASKLLDARIIKLLHQNKLERLSLASFFISLMFLSNALKWVDTTRVEVTDSDNNSSLVRMLNSMV
jgi:hypothetical protein